MCEYVCEYMLSVCECVSLTVRVGVSLCCVGCTVEEDQAMMGEK